MIDLDHLHDHRSVEAVILFGSHARGDSDVHSDVDIAVFVTATDVDTLDTVRAELFNSLTLDDVSVSLYSTRTAELLAEDGSLFLWHLNLEGRILFERNLWIWSLFSRLKPYSRQKASRDLETFARILDDVGSALRVGETTILFEAATMFSVLRNSAMIYSHAIGKPSFGRLKPITQLASVMGDQFPLSETDIRSLESLRLIYTRVPAVPLATPDTDWCLAMTSRIDRVLDFVATSIHAR